MGNIISSYEVLNKKIRKVNTLVRSKLIDHDVQFHEHSYLFKGGVPTERLFHDEKHLNKDGIALMASNMKWQIREAMHR